jgi:hypothetical protein
MARLSNLTATAIIFAMWTMTAIYYAVTPQEIFNLFK